MTNQKHFVEKSQPISDSDLYKYDMGGVDDNATDPISTQNPVSTNPVESIRESSAPQNEPQIYAEQSSAPARQENYLKYADASSFNTNEYLSTTEIQAAANTISGIQKMKEVNPADMDAFISSINSANESINAEQDLRHKEIEETRALEQEQLIASRKEEILEKRVAKEEAYRKEQEELERLREEELAREQEQAGNLISRVSGIFAGRETGQNNPETETDNTIITQTDMGESESLPCISDDMPETLPDIAPEEIESTAESAAVAETLIQEETAPLEEEVTDTPSKQKRRKKSEEKKESRKKESKKEDDTDWEYIAKHDNLTGLLNSSAYDTVLKTAALDSCVMFIDANNLKYLNDTYGHESGDKLLSMVANLLLRYFDGEAYRVGGDEFVVITNRPEAKLKKIISNMRTNLERQTKVDKTGMIYSIAIGYAYGDGKTPLTNIRSKAEEMMYKDKAAYKAEHPLFDKRKPQQETTTSDKELIGLAYTDTLTGLQNKHAFDRAPYATVLTLIRITGFDDLSRANGDKFAELVGKCMKTSAKETEACYYIGNGEFCVLSEYTPDVFLSTIKAKMHSVAIDIESQIMTGAESNELQLSLARDMIATPREKPKSYNERLTSVQRQMKDTVAANHEIVTEEDVAGMMDIIQQKGDEIIMIFMTSADFNNLFIFLEAEEFMQVAYEMGGKMDYSYIYAVYPGGALYYGADAYYSDITDLFQRIAENMSGRDIRANTISKIEGINIFQHIYIK